MRSIYLFILLIIVVITYFVCLYRESYKIKISEVHKKLYDIWEKLKPIFEKHDIKYFADSGTLLGACRHSAIIPFDDDMDIGIMIGDMKKLYSKEFKDDLKKADLEFDDNQWVYKIFPTDNLTQIFIDIFPFENKNGIIQYWTKNHRKKWPNGYYKYEELFPLNTYVFGNCTIEGAHNPDPYFFRQYGLDWMTPINDQNHHDTILDQ
jgi:lipopolysaccharide cholinephosphotransferase